MGWGIMYNGAWDYPADVRGYTWGWVHELHTRSWSFRYASAAMPRVANGLRFDRRLFRNRGDAFEIERRWEIRKHPGAARLLNYEKVGDSWVAMRIVMLEHGKEVQTEEYTNARVDQPLSSDLFDPGKWTTAPHWHR
jgi:hypothetical protein